MHVMEIFPNMKKIVIDPFGHTKVFSCQMTQITSLIWFRDS